MKNITIRLTSQVFGQPVRRTGVSKLIRQLVRIRKVNKSRDLCPSILQWHPCVSCVWQRSAPPRHLHLPTPETKKATPFLFLFIHSFTPSPNSQTPKVLKYRLPQFQILKNHKWPKPFSVRIDFLKNVCRRSQALHPGALPLTFPFPPFNIRSLISTFMFYYQCPLFIYFFLSLSISHTHSNFCFHLPVITMPPRSQHMQASSHTGLGLGWASSLRSILFCRSDNFDCICGAGIIHLQTLITSTIVSSIWTKLWWHLAFLLLWTSLPVTQLDFFFFICRQNPFLFLFSFCCRINQCLSVSIVGHAGF